MQVGFVCRMGGRNGMGWQAQTQVQVVVGGGGGPAGTVQQQCSGRAENAASEMQVSEQVVGSPLQEWQGGVSNGRAGAGSGRRWCGRTRPSRWWQKMQ